MKPIIHLVIADDHQIIRTGLKSMLKSIEGLTIIGEASDGKQAVELVKERNPDIVLIDILMPVMTGIDAVKKIKEHNKDIKALMLTSLEDKIHLLQALNAGANGYLSKEVEKEELIEAIKAVMTGERVFSSTILKVMSNPDTPIFNPDYGPPVNVYLSNREQEILRLIADGLTSQEIGDLLFISRRTVETHRTNLMDKLHVKNTVGLVRFAIFNL